jgi:hypothetical protein
MVALLAGLALGASALLHARPAEPLPPEPVSRLFDTSDCEMQPDSDSCRGVLPAELRELPTREQYVARRSAELVLRTWYPTSSQSAWPRDREALQDEQRRLQAEGEEYLRQKLLLLLQEIDPWVRVELQQDPVAAEQALLGLSRVAGWAEPPQLPDLEGSGGDRYAVEAAAFDQEVARLAPVLVEEFAERYVRARGDLLRRAWARHEQDRAAYNLAHTRQSLARASEMVLLGLGLLAALGWIALRPLRIHADLHQLRWGRHKFAWTELEGLSFRGKTAGVVAGGFSRRLWPRVLAPELQQRLVAMSEQALARLDRRADELEARVSRDEVAVSVGEVRVLAHVPHRWVLAALSSGLVGAALLLWLVSARPLPLEPALPAFQASDCQASPDLCLELLPPELRGLPTPEQYAAWRRVELARYATVPAQLSQRERDELLAEIRLGTPVDEFTTRRTLMRELSKFDPWVRERVEPGFRSSGSLSGPLGPDPEEGRLALIALSGSRDWTSVPSQPPSDLEASWSGAIELRNAQLREVVDGLVVQLAELYDRERHLQLQLAWTRLELEGRELHAQELDAWHRARARQMLLIELWALCLALATLAGLGWAWLGPQLLRVDPHHLRWGRRKFAWTEITAMSCSQGTATVSSRGASLRLWPWMLSPEGEEALREASERARERAAALPPVDRQALANVRKLHQ